MATFHTAPIDQYDESTDERFGDDRDDREIGFVFPDANGERDEGDIEHSKDRLHAVLGW